jgi:hypothetical protein
MWLHAKRVRERAIHARPEHEVWAISGILVHEAEHLLVTAAGRHLPEPVVPLDRVHRLNGGGDHPVHRAPLFSALPPERSASGNGSVRGIDPPIVDDSR